MQGRKLTSQQGELKNKLSKFIVEDYPNKKKWKDHLDKTDFSTLQTIEDYIVVLSVIDPESVIGIHHYAEVHKIIVDSILAFIQEGLNGAGNYDELNDFINNSYSKVLKLGSKFIIGCKNNPVIRVAEHALIASAWIALCERMRYLSLTASDTVGLLRVHNESKNIIAIINHDPYSHDFISYYLDYLLNLQKAGGSEISDDLLGLLDYLVKIPSVRGKFSLHADLMTHVFKLLRRLAASDITNQALLEFLSIGAVENQSFGQLVRKLNNQWLNKNYLIFVAKLFKGNTDYQLQSVLTGWSPEKKNLETILEDGEWLNLMLNLSVSAECVFEWIAKARSKKSENFMHSLSRHALGDDALQKHFLELLHRLILGGVSSQKILTVLVNQKSFGCQCFIDCLFHTQYQISPDVLKLFVGLIKTNEAVDIALDYLNGLLGNSYRKYEFIAYLILFFSLLLETEIDPNKIFSHLLTMYNSHKADFSKIYECSPCYILMDTKKVCKDFINLLIQFVKSGVPYGQVCQLLAVELPKKPHITHASHLLVAEPQVIYYGNFLSKLQQLGMLVHDIQMMLSIPTRAIRPNVMGTFFDKSSKTSFCQLVMDKKGERTGELFFHLIKYNLISQKEYSDKMRKHVFAYIKSLKDTEARREIYDEIWDADSAFGRLFYANNSMYCMPDAIPFAIRTEIKADLDYINLLQSESLADNQNSLFIHDPETASKENCSAVESEIASHKSFTF